MAFEKTLIVVLLAVSWANLQAPQRAHACSCIATGIVSGEPGPDARDVPLDVHPWIQAVVRDRSDVALEDADGNKVDAEVRVFHGGSADECVRSYAEIIPDAPLAPNAVYSVHLLTAAAGVEKTAFVTGDQMLGVQQPAAPDARFGLIFAPDHLDSCVYDSYRACIGAQEGHTLEVRVLEGDRVTGEFMSLAPQSMAFGDVDELCVEMRTRDLAGNRSAPRVVCADELDIATAEPTEEATAAWNCHYGQGLLSGQPAEDDGDDGNDSDPAQGDASSSSDSGCSTTPGSTHGSAALWLGVALFAWLRRRSRVSSRAAARALR